MIGPLQKIYGLLVRGSAVARAYPPVPAALEGQVQVPGFPGVRCWGDEAGEMLAAGLADAGSRAAAKESLNVLVLSGGGDNGAFGAGVLCGWSTTGKRPIFDLVNGISTGALMSVFAFLGPAYDDKLRQAYTSISAKDIFRRKKLFGVLTSESLADNQPLADLIAFYMDEQVLGELAAAQRQGRRLLAATTQLDAQRLVVWDLTAIAASGHEKAMTLICQVLRASSALPGVFPPVYFEVEADGQTFTEMHVDGATAAEALTYEHAVAPLAFGETPPGGDLPRRLFAIRNGTLRPDWQETRLQTLAILPRALATLIKNQSVGDLYRLYYEAKRAGFDFHLAIIPEDFRVAKRENFDPDYMNRLFTLGYEMAQGGYPWARIPPRHN